MSDTSVVSLAEFSCWDGDDLRVMRKKIWFTLRSVGKIDGVRVDQEFLADFGLMYDTDNQYTIDLLGRVWPEVKWNEMFYWRRWDISGIDVYCARTENRIAQIRVRSGGGRGSRPARDDFQLGVADAVVLDLDAFRASRVEKSQDG